jgi:hypothetical protein
MGHQRRFSGRQRDDRPAEKRPFELNALAIAPAPGRKEAAAL